MQNAKRQQFEVENGVDAKTELREARRAYKQARAAAGKSAAPKVVALIVALLMAAALGAVAMWRFGPQLMPGAFPSHEQAGLSVADADGGQEATSESGMEPGSSDNVIARSYEGTWAGEMVETSNEVSGNKYLCYGADEHPMELEVVSVDATGRVKADARVLVHAHDMAVLDRDVDSQSGDQVVGLTGLTGTLDGGSIEFKGDSSKGVEVLISVSTDDAGSPERCLRAAVRANGAEDVYLLTRR